MLLQQNYRHAKPDQLIHTSTASSSYNHPSHRSLFLMIIVFSHDVAVKVKVKAFVVFVPQIMVQVLKQLLRFLLLKKLSDTFISPVSREIIE
jgi:hypothetical protein